MKFNKIYSLSFAFVIAASLICGDTSHQTQIKKEPKKPAKTGTIKPTPKLTITTEIFVVTDEIYASDGDIAAGVFLPKKNKIIIKKLVTDSKNPDIQSMCDRNNAAADLIYAHEMHHAKKAHLTKNTKAFSAMSRARVAAINEIIAPAAEIIIATDRYYANDSIATSRPHIVAALQEIKSTVTKNNLKTPINFNNPKIAEIVLKHACAYFYKEIKSGTYRYTVNRAYNGSDSAFQFVPNEFKDFVETRFFQPDLGQWSTLWEFDTTSGKADIWRAVDNKQKTQTLQKIDSIILDVTGQKPPFLIKERIR